jgi:D-glycero-D-manno-heptose 1,7-bisphosphate phosphatase
VAWRAYIICRVRKAIFLDRDGVINHSVSPYVTSVEQLRLFPWTVECLSKLHDAGFQMFVISNQQGVKKGLYSQQDLDRITEAIQSHLRPHGFEITKFYYCTSLASENDPCRKPGSGMFEKAALEFGVELKGSFMIGDNRSDVEAGAAAGCRPLLLLSGVTAEDEDRSEWAAQPERTFTDLRDAVNWVLEQPITG